jgi:hypothetical protein
MNVLFTPRSTCFDSREELLLFRSTEIRPKKVLHMLDAFESGEHISIMRTMFRVARDKRPVDLADADSTCKPEQWLVLSLSNAHQHMTIIARTPDMDVTFAVKEPSGPSDFCGVGFPGHEADFMLCTNWYSMKTTRARMTTGRRVAESAAQMTSSIAAAQPHQDTPANVGLELVPPPPACGVREMAIS